RNNVRKRVLDQALLRAGLRRVSLHSLRHSYATTLLSQGENIRFVSAQLGHSSVSTTLNLYSHSLPAEGRLAMKRLEKTIGSNSVVRRMLENEPSDATAASAMIPETLP
ncbi:MAG: tyrosine-type recombinase/integrase, partial [Terriglobia bacterium]